MPELRESEKKAFDFAQELTKQVITLSSGIIAITISFVKDIAGPGAPGSAKVVLAFGWTLFILAVVFGIMTLMALTGSLARGDVLMSGSNTRIPAALMILAFLTGLILTVVAATLAL